MNIFKKNIYTATIEKCTSFPTVASNALVGYGFDSKVLKTYVMIIKVNNDNYILLHDLISSKLPKRMAIKTISRYKTDAKEKGDLFLSDIRPYFKNVDEFEKINLHELSYLATEPQGFTIY